MGSVLLHHMSLHTRFLKTIVLNALVLFVGIMTSPRLPQELISPRVPMLSPHAVSPSGGGHMVPVIAHTGYPPTGPPAHLNGHHSQQHTPPMYGRGLHEPGMAIPFKS